MSNLMAMAHPRRSNATFDESSATMVLLEGTKIQRQKRRVQKETRALYVVVPLQDKNKPERVVVVMMTDDVFVAAVPVGMLDNDEECAALRLDPHLPARLAPYMSQSEWRNLCERLQTSQAYSTSGPTDVKVYRRNLWIVHRVLPALTIFYLVTLIIVMGFLFRKKDHIHAENNAETQHPGLSIAALVLILVAAAVGEGLRQSMNRTQAAVTEFEDHRASLIKPVLWQVSRQYAHKPGALAFVFRPGLATKMMGDTIAGTTIGTTTTSHSSIEVLVKRQSGKAATTPSTVSTHRVADDSSFQQLV